MKRFFIEEAKCGITDEGMACSVVATIRFRDDEGIKWLSLVEVEGIPNVYLSDRDLHEKFVSADFDEGFYEYLERFTVSDFNGLSFDGDYATTYSSIAEDPDNPAIPLIRYLFTLVRCETDEVPNLIEMARNKYADELEIPVCDVEEEFLEENEEYEEE